MKKVKRILAMLMAMVMVLGMAVTAFAAPKESATITIGDADEATITYAQVIKADPTTTTGWAFVSNDIAKAYTDAFNVTDSQVAIGMLIKYEAEKEGAATAEQIGKALSNVAALNIFLSMENPQSVDSAGVYAIKLGGEGYTYNNMAAYVGFGEVKNDDGEVINEYPSLIDTEMAAKKTPISTTKEDNDADKVVSIGSIVEYTVETYVPFINPNDTNKTFRIHDEIQGADYYLTGEGSVATVMINEESVGTIVVDTTDTHKFDINLDSLIDDANSKAGQKVVVTYTAKVTAVEVDNTVKAGHAGSSEYGSDSDEVYTGQITLTKYAEDGATKLAGAGFKVTKGEDTNALTFSRESDGTYIYNPAGTITEVVTATTGEAKGTLVVKGLDVGSYHFEEVTAPEGYSINADGANAILSVEEGKVAEAVITAGTQLNDTKLAALPSTGGIGTYIFTIVGILIMAAAAGFFFVSRRKANR